MAKREITMEDAEKLLAEWIEIEKNKHTPVMPHEITPRDYARKTGISSDTARDILDKLVQDGKWARRAAYQNQRRVWAYWPKVKP